MTDPIDEKNWLWHRRSSLTILIVLVLGVTMGIAGVGALGAFAIAIIVSLIARKQGSFRDMGFRSPESWGGLLGTTLAYGVVIQLTFTIIVDPGLEQLTGYAVDISSFDNVRGNFVNFLILMAIGWGVGGFLEEFTFRGFVVGRLRWLLGSGTAATWFAVLVAATAFGVAHLYQGVSGVISAGMIGLILGAVYIYHRSNLWYAVFTHGFTNTFGITFIYLDMDRNLNGLLS